MLCDLIYTGTYEGMLNLNLTLQYWYQVAHLTCFKQDLCGIVCIYGFTTCHFIFMAVHLLHITHNTSAIYIVYNIGKYTIFDRPSEAM